MQNLYKCRCCATTAPACASDRCMPWHLLGTCARFRARHAAATTRLTSRDTLDTGCAFLHTAKTCSSCISLPDRHVHPCPCATVQRLTNNGAVTPQLTVNTACPLHTWQCAALRCSHSDVLQPAQQLLVHAILLDKGGVQPAQQQQLLHAVMLYKGVNATSAALHCVQCRAQGQHVRTHSACTQAEETTHKCTRSNVLLLMPGALCCSAVTDPL